MYKYIKRFMDLILAVVALPCLVISIFFVGLVIKIEDRGPVFYKAARIGKQGKIFAMYKFRSMKVNAPDLRLSDGSTYNSEDDPRVTKVGKFIRKTSIDEIPQLINILIGQMSFIGPRPDSAIWLDNYTDEERIILSVVPGISGYNQVISRNRSSTKEKLQNDIYYVKHQSFSLDTWIFIETIKAVLLSKNVYRKADATNTQYD